MKQKLLLVSTAMLMASSVYADWKMPSTPVDPTVDGKSTYLLYNTGAKGFLVAGNAWGTHACVAKEDSIPEGYYFRLSAVAGAENTVIMEDSCLVKSNKWMKMFDDGEFDNIFMDHGSQTPAEKTHWILNKLEDGSYNIENVQIKNTKEGGPYYLGVSKDLPYTEVGGSGGSLATGAANLSMLDAESEGLVNWIFLDGSLVKAYKMSGDLKAAIDTAKAHFPTLDLAAEESVYANEDGSKTLKDIVDALASIVTKQNKAIAEEAVKTATVENPYSMSSRIINGDFSKTNASDFIGTAPAFGYGAAEFYNKNYDIHQELTEMPNGVYVFSLDGFYRAGSIEADYAAWKAGNGYNAQFYIANMTAADTVYRYGNLSHLYDGAPVVQPAWVTEVHTAKENDSNPGSYRKTTQEGVDYYIPNSMYQFSLANANGLYKGSKIAMCVTEGRISVGLKKTVAVSTDWTIFDNFALDYYGDGESAYNFLMNDYKQSAVLPEDFLASKELKEAYEAALENASAANYAEYLAAVAGIEEIRQQIDSNAVYWNKLKAAVELAEELVYNTDYEGLCGDLSDLVTDAKDNMDPEDGLELTEEEIEDLIKELLAEYESVKSQTKPGTDMTSLIVNNNFAKGDEGWTLVNPTKATLKTNASAKCAEAYDNKDFDIYQLITGAPAGIYQISLQGFVRPARDKEAWLKHFDNEGKPLAHPTDTLDAFIYMNDALNRLPSVFTYQTYTKDSIYKGTDFWADDLEYEPEGDTVVYKSTYAYPNDMASAGIAFGRGAYKTSAFGLVAEGDTMRIGMKGSIGGPNWAIFTNFSLIYQGYLVEYVQPMLEAKLAEMNVSFINDDELQCMGADVFASISEAKAIGEAALATGDGKKMYDALCEMLPVINKINASKTLFSNLMEAYKDLVNTYAQYADAREAIRTQAADLQSELENGLSEEMSYNDADIPALIEKIKGLVAALKIPASVLDATGDKPADLTMVLVNPSFETGNLDGWKNENFQAQKNDAFAKVGTYYCERWHVDEALKLSQELSQKAVGLPEGIYGISVLAAYSGDGLSEIGNNAYLYVAGVDTVAFTSMVALEPSRIEVKFEVKENDVITFGVNSQLTTTTWCTFDDFQLKFYGNGVSAIETLEAKKSEAVVAIYDINGVKTSTLKSGVNIVRTVDAQGNLKTRKVFVK